MNTKGINKPVKLNSDMAEFCGSRELSRAEVSKKIWAYVKNHKLQAKTENGKPTDSGKFIVADQTLLKLFRNTNSIKKDGSTTDLRTMKIGETINMMKLSTVIAANVSA